MSDVKGIRKLTLNIKRKPKKNKAIKEKKTFKISVKSLKIQILFIFLVSIILACSVISIYTYNYSSSYILNKEQRNLETIAYQSATNISYKFSSEKEKTELLAGNYVVTDSKISRENKLDFLKKQAKKNDSIALCVFDTGGLQISSNLQNYEVTQRNFYKKALSGTTQMSDVYIEKNKTFVKVNIYYASPIYDDSDILQGVLLNVKDAKEISLYLGNINISENSSCYILDESYNIIADKNIQKVIDNTNLSKIEDYGTKELLSKIQSEKKGYGTFKINGISNIVGYSPIEGTKYTLVVQSPAQEMLGDINSLKQITINVLLASIIVMSILILLFLNKELNPLSKIAENAKLISEGDLIFDGNNMNQKKNEIGVLSKAFHNMTGKLSTIMKNLMDVSGNVHNIGDDIGVNFKKNLIYNEEINGAIKNIIDTNDQQLAEVNKGKGLIDLLTCNLNEIHNNLTELSERTIQMHTYIDESTDICNDLMEDARDSVAAGKNMNISLDKTSESVQNINDKLSEITKITKKINLVSFNAQIEAARSSSENSSFTVVAKEINNLAEQTGKFTDEIVKMFKILNDNVGILKNNLQIIMGINDKQYEGTARNLEHFINIQDKIIEINEKTENVKQSSWEISKEKDEIINHFQYIMFQSNENKGHIDAIKDKMSQNNNMAVLLTKQSALLIEESQKLIKYSNYFKIK